MSKQVIVLAPDFVPDRPRRKLLPIASLLLAASLLTPIVIDATTLCYGQWRAMIGSPIDVRTPTFDAIGEQTALVREEVKYHILSRFQHVPWDYRSVLFVSVVVMLLAMVMLRL